MSGRASKIKGNRIERECVNLAREHGLKARRAWGSDGRSLGWHEEVDMIIEQPDRDEPLKFQIKGRKSIADYLKPSDDVDGQILKEDRQKILIVIPLEDYLKMVKELE